MQFLSVSRPLLRDLTACMIEEYGRAELLMSDHKPVGHLP